MLTSITPLGERGRNNRWTTTVVAYILGSLVGGAVVGALLGAIGTRSAAALGATGVLWSIVGLVILGLSLDFAGVPPPGLRRQVNDDWLTQYRGWVYGFGFGFQLGAGIMTIVSSSIVWVVLAAAFLAGSASAGALLLGVFGLARGLTVLATVRVRDRNSLFALAAWMRRGQPIAERLVRATMLIVAGVTMRVLIG